MMHTISSTAIGVFAILVTFGLAVFVHEFGHMIFALLCGVRVESFAIGMGPRMYSWKWGGIDFSLRWLPVGGFVKLKGMVAEEEPAAEGQDPAQASAAGDKTPEKTLNESSYDDMFALRNKGLIAKLLVFGGGVFMNFVTAVVAMAIFLTMPEKVAIDPPRIDRVIAGTPAETYGFQHGDMIVAINDHPTPTDGSVRQRVQEAFESRNDTGFWTRLMHGAPPVKSYELDVTIKRDGVSIKKTMKEIARDPETTGALGIVFWYPPVVGELHPLMPAERAGIKVGDRIVAVNGRPVQSYYDIGEALYQYINQETTIRVERDGKQLDLQTKVLNDPLTMGQGTIGFEHVPAEQHVIPGLPFWDAVLAAPGATARRFVGIIVLQYEFFKRASFRDVTEGLGGPVMMATMSARQAQKGLRPSINWFIIINLALLMFNVLPLPVLDGGFLLLSVIEAVIRRPVSPKILNPIFTVFMIFFIGLMLLITFWDIRRFLF